MCGRYTNQYAWRQLHELYSLSDQSFPTSNFEPRYNIAPTQTAPVVRLKDGKREVAFLRWGLVPSWSRDDKGGTRMINAKAETVANKPAYRSAFLRRRCLVVADGFYEWAKVTPKEKQPYFITTKDHAAFAFAGLWEWWKPRDGSAIVETYTIITTEPNALCAPLHDRMPVMLGPEDWALWLGDGGEATPARLEKLLRPFPAEKMECWTVGKAVGNVKNEGPKLVERG